MEAGEVTRGLIPVRDSGRTEPEEAIALSLSGGGYRAMLFLGGIVRLKETGHLKEIARVSSVSGGSITAGVLALAWQQLDFETGGIEGEPTRLPAE
jgi:NTE family protein